MKGKKGKDFGLDVVAFGAHPDDVEIGAGAFLLKMKRLGYSTGVVHLTDGDMGKGDPKKRREEARAAARLLQVDVLEFMNLGDCRLEDNQENRVKVAGIIRRLRPRLVLAPYFGTEPGRGLGHADHIAGGYLVTHAANFAHLEKFPASGRAHAIQRLMYYQFSPFIKPSIVVPVDEEFPISIEALKQHETQFGKIEHEWFRELIEAGAKRLGWMVGARFALGFLLTAPLRVDDPLQLLCPEE